MAGKGRFEAGSQAPRRGRRGLIAALCAGYFLVLLDVTVVNVALPSIGRQLEADHMGLAGVVDGYAVPLAVLLLVAGGAGDRLGHRRIVVAGFVGFGIASLACALAPSLGMLIAGRSMQGISAALVLPGTLAMLTDLAHDDADRSRLVGVWASLGGIALPAGPLLGGVVVTVIGWRSVFWLNLPIIALALIPLVRAEVGRRKVSRVSRDAYAQVRRGNGTVRCSADGSERDPRQGADREGTVSPQARTSPPSAPAARSVAKFVIACGVAGLMNFAVLGTLLLLTEDLQDLRGLSPIAAGLATLPALLPLPLLGVVAGRLSARLGEWRGSALGLVVAAVGFAGIAWSLVRGTEMPWLLYPALAVWGCGIGLLTPAIVAAAMDAMPGTPGIASGGSNTARQAGGAIRVAVFAAFAGSGAAVGFADRAAVIVLGAGGAFVAAAVLCLGVGTGFGGGKRRGCPSLNGGCPSLNGR